MLANLPGLCSIACSAADKVVRLLPDGLRVSRRTLTKTGFPTTMTTTSSEKKALTNLIGGVTWVIAPFTPGDASNLSDFLFSTRWSCIANARAMACPRRLLLSLRKLSGDGCGSLPAFTTKCKQEKKGVYLQNCVCVHFFKWQIKVLFYTTVRVNVSAAKMSSI